MSGIRRASASNAIAPSMRASEAPMQKWGPPPKLSGAGSALRMSTSFGFS